MSGVLSERGLLLSPSNSKGAPTTDSETGREGPKRRDPSFRACDNCSIAKVRCGRKEPGGTCHRIPPTNRSKRPRTLVTLQTLHDAASDPTVLPTAKVKKGRKCQRCSRMRIGCEDWVPCKACRRASHKCVMPTRAAPGSGGYRGPNSARREVPLTPELQPGSIPNLPDLPHPFSSGRTPTLFGYASRDTQATPFQQPSSWHSQMTLTGYGATQPQPQLQSLRATEIYDFPVMGPEVTGFGNYSFDEEAGNTAILVGSQQSILLEHPLNQAWFENVSNSASPFAQYSPFSSSSVASARPAADVPAAVVSAAAASTYVVEGRGRRGAGPR